MGEVFGGRELLRGHVRGPKGFELLNKMRMIQNDEMRDGWQELSGAPFVGVASEAGFAAGYKCKGLFFGGPGNLSDGGALVRSHFGEPICQ